MTRRDLVIKDLPSCFVLDKRIERFSGSIRNIFVRSDRTRIDRFVLFIVPERFLNERQESIKVALRELQKLRIYSIDIRIFDVAEKFFSSWTERRAICNFHYLQHRFEKAVAWIEMVRGEGEDWSLNPSIQRLARTVEIETAKLQVYGFAERSVYFSR